jgi:multisubunit Na+/H+ antiporter MnhC subunit
MDQAVRRSHRRRRGWILAGSAVLALAVVMGIKPDNFTMFADLHFPLQRVGDLAAAVPASGLIVVLLITALVIGASKTVDNL